MIARARWCAPIALAGALGWVVGGPAYARTQSVSVQPSPIHQVPDGEDGQPEAPRVADVGQLAPGPDLGSATASAGPRVAVARRIVDAAGAFDGYMRRAAAIKANFASGEAVARSVRLGSTFQAEQLEEGAIAYAALVALQDPDFVEAVRDVAQNSRARDQFAARILERPEVVLDAPVARRAITRVSTVLGRMGLQLVAAGAAVKQSAYDIQHQGWSKGAIVDPEKRLARIKAESSAPVSLVPADTAHLFTGLTSLWAPGEEARAADEATPVAMRGLAIAALAILGRAGDDQVQSLTPLLTDAKDAQCIKMARLNLNQCLAVAGPHYEDVFCLGRHAMMETGQCIAVAAGVHEEEIQPAADTTSVLVPVAVAAAPASGPERDSAFSRAQTVDEDDVAVPLAAVQPKAVVNYSPYAGPLDP